VHPMVNRTSKGFTLVEMLIVIALIGILAAALVEKMDAALAQARDSRRKSDLRKMQSVLMTYYARNGKYPTSWLNGAGQYTWSNSDPRPVNGTWNNGDWLPGLVPTYIPALPSDPKGGLGTYTGAFPCNLNWRAYLYESDGQHYKLLAWCGPETIPQVQAEAQKDPFYDPLRWQYSWMVCDGEPACSTW
jgi:prepilin-type N-terminal cleavage/methylation domain-containing protein